jgi:hypothetical protein
VVKSRGARPEFLPRRGIYDSNRRRLRQNPIPNLTRQITSRSEIDSYTEQFLQLDLQTTQVEQSCPLRRVDKEIEVAPIPVRAMQHGTEDARIGGTKTAGRLTYRGSVLLKSG